jgi:hypothetical protein
MTAAPAPGSRTRDGVRRPGDLLHIDGTIMADLAAVYANLRAILGPYARQLDAKRDDGTELYVDTRHIQANRKPLFFGAVQIKKSHVSFHLMPVYLKPELLAGLSPALDARMQGKSCFNFKVSDPGLFHELAELTERGFESYRSQGYV